MSRTNGRFAQKTPNSDGVLYLPASAFAVSGTAAWTRNAVGDYSVNVGAAETVYLVGELENAIFRTGQLGHFQEEFGTAAGVAGPSTVANTSDVDGMNSSPYFPPMPYANLSTIEGGVAGFVPKGIQINNLELHYIIGTLAVTTHSVGIVQSVMPVAGTPAALGISYPLAIGANGLSKAVTATPQTTLITLATPSFSVTDLAQLAVEVEVVTPATSTYQLYGATLHVSFNYN